MHRQLLFVVLALCAGIACGGAQPSSNHHVPAVWRELTSEHFVVWTNTSEARARKLVKTMENLRQVVLGVSFFKHEVRGKSFVIAFDGVDEVHQYVPPQFIAHAWSGYNMLRQPVIVLAASSLDDDRRIVTHELTHVIAFNVLPAQPAWFAEGLAGYFETVRLDEDKATIEVGVPIENRMAQLAEDGLTPAAQLFACDRPACMDDRFYATTWALMTYLMNEHYAELMQYVARLADTPDAQQAKLWDIVFPGLPLAKLDHELASWVHYGRIKVMHYKIALRDWPAIEKPLTEADALAAKGLLRFLIAPRPDLPVETMQALTLDATNVVANMVAGAARQSVAPELGRAITAAHPDDWRAWWLAWRAAQTGDESRAARDKTCALIEASAMSVPIPECGRDDAGAIAEDPRRPAVMAATAQFGPCLARSKHEQIVETMTIDLEITEAGTVTQATVAMGSPETNACVEHILKGLTFPAHHPGPYHVGLSRPPARSP